MIIRKGSVKRAGTAPVQNSGTITDDPEQTVNKLVRAITSQAMRCL